MRRTIFQESPVLHDELIANFRQNQQAPVDTFLPIWPATWVRFERDICSYIIPAIVEASNKQVMIQQNTPAVLNKIQKHSFSFAYSTRQLKRVINLHCKMDIIAQIRKQITSIFYRIANAFVTNCLKNQNQNLFNTVVEIYGKIQSKLDVLVGCLSLVIGKFITKKGIQDELFSIINKQLVNHQQYQYFVNLCINAIDQLRDMYLDTKTRSKNNSLLLTNNQTINKIKLLNRLKIFPYVEYLERSKKYYSELLIKVPKNIWMFSVLYNLIKCQKALQYVITPDQQQLQNVKKILKNQPWRPLQQQSIIKIFCKEVLDEIYDDLIEYIDYLINPQSEQNKNSKVEKSQFINTGDKKQLLKYLWQLTKILQKNITNQKPKYSNNDKKISPKTKLFNRMTLIVSDIRKYINSADSNQLYKIIHFRDHVLSVISQCFDNDSKFLNAITIKMEEIIVQQQEFYNEKLCLIILSTSYKFPGTGSNIFTNIKQNQMMDQSQQNQNQNLTQVQKLNNKCSFQLFKLTPSKQQFIRKFQQQFSSYIIPNWNKINLTQQEFFIKPIQKQCGYSLSRNIERMLHDVWRNGEPIFYKYENMICKILCQDWPNFQESKYKLADGLLEVRAEFQVQFLSRPQNDKKKLKWVQEFGRIQIAIAGIQSIFSELQGSIIFLLSKSYRPLKIKQFKQVLLYKQDDMQFILEQLTNKNIVIYNNDADNYQLNYQNLISYQFEFKQKIAAKSQKKSIQKDYTTVVQAYIARILKRKKSVQKTDLSKILCNQIKIDGHQPTIEQINTALQRLRTKQVINIQKTRGIIKYLE